MLYFGCCLLPRVTSWIVPRKIRPQWRACWDRKLGDWRILAVRGELPRGSWRALCRDMAGDALRYRFTKTPRFDWTGSPQFFIAAASAALVVTWMLSQGFSATRTLIEITRTFWVHSAPLKPYDFRGDVLFRYFAPVVIALGAGFVAGWMRFGTLPRRGARFWLFFAFKALMLAAVLPLAWIEGGTALRASIASEPLRVIGGGFGLAAAFVAVFGWAADWIVVDQRRRCPVCLWWLDMPVALGSWGSVFEPAATEMLCRRGHGALVVAETESSPGDQWTALDDSWQGQFHDK